MSHSDSPELIYCKHCGEPKDPEFLGVPTCCNSAVLEIVTQLREDKARLMLDNASWESTCSRLKAMVGKEIDKFLNAPNKEGER